MNCLKIGLSLMAIVSLSLSSTQAQNMATSKAEYCSNSKSIGFAQKYLEDRDSRMSFRNHGGLVGGGVCWWHSRFQRNATYLAIYRPDLPMPTMNEAYEIIERIRHVKGVTIIPGYSNFNDFSSDHYERIQKVLEAWQRVDGFVFQQWVVGLAGGSTTTPEKLKDIMDDLYKQVDNGDVVYQKLQIKGIVAHAWLVIDMNKTNDGYELKVIDSNYPSSTNTHRYRFGDSEFHLSGFGRFVPYIGKNSELRKLKREIRQYCR